MAKVKSAGSNNKINFGKRRKGRSKKSFNKHDNTDKQKYGYSNNK